jgi:hypothetical protein
MAQLGDLPIVRQFSGETVMGWIIALAALGLAMTALTLAELRQPVRANAIKLPDFTVGDRVIAAFVLVTFTLALVNGLLLLAIKALP